VCERGRDRDIHEERSGLSSRCERERVKERERERERERYEKRCTRKEMQGVGVG
jgi:hypothetical protein